MSEEPKSEVPGAAWLARHKAHLSEIGEKAGFDATPDHAVLIARYFEIARNRFHEDRDDPVLGPIIAQAGARYDELRMHDFTFASHVATVEAVRTILALELPVAFGKIPEHST